MHGAGFILDSINRMKSNRSLTKKDRGAFNIQEKNTQIRLNRNIAIYKKATPQYMSQLKAQIQLEKQHQSRLIVVKSIVIITLFAGLLYLVFGFTF